jgi:hypothetical protein
LRQPTFKLEQTKTGCHVRWIKNSTVILQQRFQLRHFPFDRQHLYLKYSVPRTKDRYVSFAKNSELIFSDEVSVAGFTFMKKPNLYVFSESGGGYQKRAHGVFVLSLKRDSFSFVLNVEVLMLCIVLFNTSIFWIDTQLDDGYALRVQVIVTCVVSMAALRLSINDSLPAGSELTAFDRYSIACYFSVLALLGIQAFLRDDPDGLWKAELAWCACLFVYLAVRFCVVTCRADSEENERKRPRCSPLQIFL